MWFIPQLRIVLSINYWQNKIELYAPSIWILFIVYYSKKKNHQNQIGMFPNLPDNLRFCRFDEIPLGIISWRYFEMSKICWGSSVFRCNSFHDYGMFIAFVKIFRFSFFWVHVPEINVCRKSSLTQWELVWQIRARSSIQCGIKNVSKHSYRRRRNERRVKEQSGKPNQLILGILRYCRQSSDASRQH